MSKAVLISIRPEWCEKIGSGEKTIEVRKTRPALSTPFKCYIYETQGKTETPWMDEDGHWDFHGRGKVIGEFTCGEIVPVDVPYPAYIHEVNPEVLDASCLSYWDLHQYGGSGKRLYGWHITDLVIYGEPKPLTDFYRPPCERMSDCGCCLKWDRENRACKRPSVLMRAPQSWCYVEEL